LDARSRFLVLDSFRGDVENWSRVCRAFVAHRTRELQFVDLVSRAAGLRIGARPGADKRAPSFPQSE
jgi:hypothetical protein